LRPALGRAARSVWTRTDFWGTALTLFGSGSALRSASSVPPLPRTEASAKAIRRFSSKAIDCPAVHDGGAIWPQSDWKRFPSRAARSRGSARRPARSETI